MTDNDLFYVLGFLVTFLTKPFCVCISFRSVEHLSQELNPPEAFSSVSILTMRPDPCLISLYTSAHTEVNLNSFISVCVFVPQYVSTLQRYLLIFLQIVYLPSTLYLYCIVVLSLCICMCLM